MTRVFTVNEIVMMLSIKHRQCQTQSKAKQRLIRTQQTKQQRVFTRIYGQEV